MRRDLDRNDDSSVSSIMHHKFCLIDSKWLYSCDSANENQRNVFISKKDKNHVKSAVKSIPKDGIVLSGSVNWTMQGFAANCDNVVFLSSKEVVVKFQKEFEKMYHMFK